MNEPGSELVNKMLSILRQSRFVSLLVLSAMAGALTGFLIAFALDRSEYALMVAQLSDYESSVLSRVYADDGTTVIGEFYLERRIPIPYRQIPERVRQAFIAIEDARFYHHYGLDFIRIVRALWDNIREGRIVAGASTITQQVARGIYLSREQTLSRKLKEALLALLIERYYTKEQILELYCNQIYLGGNAYGVEAAAQYYFGKSARDLTLAESAMLAALPKAPVSYSPVLHPQAARRRRNLVLDAMVEQGFISRAEAERAKREPIRLSTGERINNVDSPYAYVVEMVRRTLERQYGTHKTHAGGLQIYTTINVRAQEAAVRAVRQGLHAFDLRHGWRNKLENILDEGYSLRGYYHPDWDGPFEVGDYVTGLVMQVSNREALVRFGEYTARVTRSDVPWHRPLKRLVRPGDVTIFRIDGIDTATKHLKVTLLQLPAVQGALVALEIPSGEIKALVGGYDFNRSRFNRATQGKRQTGSAFKPFIYTAAIEYGLTPESPVEDEPFILDDWEPQNYDEKFMGVIDIATAVALSRNVPAVRILQEVGIHRAAEVVDRLGLSNPMAPYLPSALGATEEPLLDMVKAYAVFANLGKRVYPHFIRRVVDRDGTELQRWQSPPEEEVLSPYVASTVVSLLEGVVERGTAHAIRAHAEFDQWDIGGKTGTVNDFTDAWFIGFTPTVCAGVWVGYDEKKSLGKGETGARAALPIWIAFMKEYLKSQRPQTFTLVTEPPPMLAELQAQRQQERGAWAIGSGGRPLPLVGEPPRLDVLPVPAPNSPEGLLPSQNILQPPPLPPAARPPDSRPQRRERRIKP